MYRGGEPRSHNPLCELKKTGQSVWLDFITRDLVRSGKLAGLVENDCLSGVTVNPTIFEQAVTGSDAYDEDIRRLIGRRPATQEVYHRLMTKDVMDACDMLRGVYDENRGLDGFVSMEVAPKYAHDVESTVKEARELVAEAAHRRNLMIKVPGTVEGREAVRRLTAEGFNINVTLLFSPDQYLPVAEAYMAGLEERLARGWPVDNVISVASVFVSRIDTMVDKELDRLAEDRGGPEAEKARQLRGAVGTATAKMTYQAYSELLRSDRWKALADEGVCPQRVLWGSTGTKDPAYSDVKYIEALVGSGTVNTMPLKTLEAFRDHGRVAPTLTEGVDEAKKQLAEVRGLGIDLDKVYFQLQEEGVIKFAESYDHLFAVLEDKCRRMSAA